MPDLLFKKVFALVQELTGASDIDLTNKIINCNKDDLIGYEKKLYEKIYLTLLNDEELKNDLFFQERTMFMISGFDKNENEVICECGYYPTPNALGNAIMEMMKKNPDIIYTQIRKDMNHDRSKKAS